MDQRLVAALRAAAADLRRDTILMIRPYERLEREIVGVDSLHAVRTLGTLKVQQAPEGRVQFAIDDPVRASLDEWSRSSRNDFNKVIARLKTAAKEQEITNSNIMKPVQHARARGLHELVAKRDHARVFLFYERAAQSLIICSGTYWKTGREREHQTQDAAILRAAALRDLWKQARPLQGHPDARILKGN